MTFNNPYLDAQIRTIVRDEMQKQTSNAIGMGIVNAIGEGLSDDQGKLITAALPRLAEFFRSKSGKDVVQVFVSELDGYLKSGAPIK